MDIDGNTLHCLMLQQVIKMVSNSAGRMMGVVKIARSLADKDGSISYLIESLTKPPSRTIGNPFLQLPSQGVHTERVHCTTPHCSNYNRSDNESTLWSTSVGGGGLAWTVE